MALGGKKLLVIPRVDPSKPAPRAKPKKVEVLVDRGGGEELKVEVITKTVLTVMEFGERLALSRLMGGGGAVAHDPPPTLPHTKYRVQQPLATGYLTLDT